MLLAKKYSACAFFLLLLISFSSPALAKSYSYDYININLDMQPDGSVIVTQERAYDFSGSFSYAYLDVLKQGAEDVQFIEIKDMDKNMPLQYELVNGANHIQATWHYTANNEVRRFQIKYKITGAVQRYEDVAEFYWKVIEDEHETINRLNVDVNLPSASPSIFKIFVHSSANPGTLNFSSDYSKAYVTMQDIRKDTFVEFRVLLDPSIFGNLTQMPQKEYQPILDEEKNIVYTSAVSGFFMAAPVIVLLLLIPIIVFLYFYWKYGRDPKVDYVIPYEHEPPQKVPPMALSNLLEGEEDESDISIEARGLLATIFDLARRGYLEVREVKKKKLFGLMDKTEQVFVITKKGHDKKEISKLPDFESAIMDFIISCGSAPGEVTSSEITEYCQRNGMKVKQKIEAIDRSARSWFEEKYFPITDTSSRKEMHKFWIFLAGYAAFALVLSLLSGPAIIIFVFIEAIILFVFSRAIVRRTYKSALEIKRWKAFKRFISDFSAMKDAPATLLHIWDEYLVYAIALGVAEKLLENIKNLSIQTGTPIVAVAWYHGISPVPSGTISPQAITGFIDNLSNTVNALNSSTSVGGGFSGGGGGGGGGGGSGAG